MSFTHEVHDVPRMPERQESWRAEIAGYRVTVERRDDGRTEVTISRDRPGRYRPLVKCSPRCVEDLEHVAAVLPELIQAAAAELRAAGLDDLRSSLDVMIDERFQLLADSAARLDARTPPPPQS